MQEIVRLCALSLATCLLVSLLKNCKSEYVFLIVLATGAYYFFYGVRGFVQIGDSIEKLRSFLGGYEEYLTLIMKVTGISFLCQFCAGLCRDAGHSCISDQIEMMGKLWIMFSGFPILLDVVSRIEQML